jgi:hypothetical protein
MVKKKSKYFKPKPLTVFQQLLRMTALHPNFNLTKLDQSRIAWAGVVTPSPLSESYTVEVSYELHCSPRISVISPKLRRREDGKPIPHVYKGEKLCLYHPPSKEWHGNKLIADTIIPWISLWLFYYEAWHATGKWLGGGVEHSGEDKL